MILRTLTWPLLRHIRRQIITRILHYCRHAGWPEKEIHNARRALIILIRILLRLLIERFILRDTASAFGHNNTSCRSA